MREKRPLRCSKYLALTKASIMEGLAFRVSTIVSIIGNLCYLVIIYFLWKAIYASSTTEVVNGMSFYNTMIYLVLASAMFSFMDCFVVWNIGNDFQSGRIVLYLCKPMDYQAYMFWAMSGNIIVAFVTTFLPTLIIVNIVTHGAIALGMNLLMTMVSIIFAIILNFCVDFFVGLICFYTQSVWGVNIMKEVVVALFSGATIPLVFFPDKLRLIVNYMPFQAIYNSPLQILTGQNLRMTDYLHMLSMQVLWVIIMLLLCRLFWLLSKRAITVNGG